MHIYDLHSSSQIVLNNYSRCSILCHSISVFEVLAERNAGTYSECLVSWNHDLGMEFNRSE